jgi:hypothetical protein
MNLLSLLTRVTTTLGFNVQSPLVSTQDSDPIVSILPATDLEIGAVKPDGTTITVAPDGTLSAAGGGGTVTDVTGTPPIVSSGGATPAISVEPGSQSANLANASRHLATVYQNTGDKALFITLSTALGTNLVINSDAANPPTTPLWQNDNSGSTIQSGFAVIQPGNFYEATSDGVVLSTWFESTW